MAATDILRSVGRSAFSHGPSLAFPFRLKKASPPGLRKTLLWQPHNAYTFPCCFVVDCYDSPIVIASIWDGKGESVDSSPLSVTLNERNSTLKVQEPNWWYLHTIYWDLSPRLKVFDSQVGRYQVTRNGVRAAYLYKTILKPYFYDSPKSNRFKTRNKNQEQCVCMICLLSLLSVTFNVTQKAKNPPLKPYRYQTLYNSTEVLTI